MTQLKKVTLRFLDLYRILIVDGKGEILETFLVDGTVQETVRQFIILNGYTVSEKTILRFPFLRQKAVLCTKKIQR